MHLRGIGVFLAFQWVGMLPWVSLRCIVVLGPLQCVGASLGVPALQGGPWAVQCVGASVGVHWIRFLLLSEERPAEVPVCVIALIGL